MSGSTVISGVRHRSERTPIRILTSASQLDLPIEVYALVSNALAFVLTNLLASPIPAEVALSFRVLSIKPTS